MPRTNSADHRLNSPLYSTASRRVIAYVNSVYDTLASWEELHRKPPKLPQYFQSVYPLRNRSADLPGDRHRCAKSGFERRIFQSVITSCSGEGRLFNSTRHDRERNGPAPPTTTAAHATPVLCVPGVSHLPTTRALKSHTAKT